MSEALLTPTDVETSAIPFSKPLPKGAITWFELSTANIDRAVTFYRTVLAEPLIDISTESVPMFLFPLHGGEVTGALVERPGRLPNAGGTLIYLRVADALANAMERVAPAGGSLVTGAMVVPNVGGTFCVIQDTEGNHVGLHATL